MAVLYNTSGIAVETSTGASTLTSSKVGLIVRLATPDSTSANGLTTTNGSNTIFTSQAGSWYVYAYVVGPVAQASTSEQRFRFLSSGGASTVSHWTVRQWSSGGSTVGYFGGGDALAVSPPAFLFRGLPGSKLVLSALSSNNSYSVAAWNQ